MNPLVEKAVNALIRGKDNKPDINHVWSSELHLECLLSAFTEPKLKALFEAHQQEHSVLMKESFVRRLTLLFIRYEFKDLESELTEANNGKHCEVKYAYEVVVGKLTADLQISIKELNAIKKRRKALEDMLWEFGPGILVLMGSSRSL